MELVERLRTETEGHHGPRTDLCREAADEIERLKREGVPGKMHQVDHAFYRLTVLQRDLAWSEVEAMRTLIQIQRERIEALENPEPEPFKGCPLCHERIRIEVNLVDVGGPGGMVEHTVGSYRCLNPECPSNQPRKVHAHPTWNSGYGPDRTPCCGLLLAELPTGTMTTTDPHNVTCGGGKTTDNPEEGTNHG